jgi:hypothetical protein
MNRTALLTLLFAGGASAEVVSEGSGTYMVTNGGPVLGLTIVAVYQEATAFCEKQHKEVATMKLDQNDQPHQFKSAGTGARACPVAPPGANGSSPVSGSALQRDAASRQ